MIKNLKAVFYAIPLGLTMELISDSDDVFISHEYFSSLE
jgi:hypothetical protein